MLCYTLLKHSFIKIRHIFKVVIAVIYLPPKQRDCEWRHKSADVMISHFVRQWFSRALPQNLRKIKKPKMDLLSMTNKFLYVNAVDRANSCLACPAFQQFDDYTSWKKSSHQWVRIKGNIKHPIEAIQLEHFWPVVFL